MSYPLTRIIVKDNPPPRRQVISVGRLYDCSPRVADEPEIVFSTVERADESLEETKVVTGRRGRRPAPKSTEAAETK